MKNKNCFKEEDYSVFEFPKKIIHFNDLFSQNKWKSKIRSELEKIYPNFDSYTFWQAKGLYTLWSKKIIVIVIEPEIYASYRLKNKNLYIVYKEKKYSIKPETIQIFLRSIFFMVCLLFLCVYISSKNNTSSISGNSNLISESKSNVLSSYDENNDPEIEQKELLSLFQCIDILNGENGNTKINFLNWNIDERNERTELLVEMYPEEIKTKLSFNNYVEESVEIISVSYTDNKVHTRVCFESNTHLESIEKMDMENFRKHVVNSGGKFLKETNDMSAIFFQIPVSKISCLLSMLNDFLLVRDLEIEIENELAYLNIGIAQKGISLSKVLNYFVDTVAIEKQNQAVSQEHLKSQHESQNEREKIKKGFFLGTIIDESGNENQYFKDQDNKIFFIKTYTVGKEI